jgi:Ca2+:H+ antiporter
VSQPSAVRQRNGVNGRSEKDEAPNGQDGEDGSKKKKEHRLFKSVQPKEPYTVGNQLQRTVLNSWINVLLVMVPVGIAVNYVKSVDRVAVFVINFIAIIPLAAMLSFSTEEIALRTGETLGGLLNATFGNAVELIVAIMALTQKPAKVIIVQTSLIGSILSNLLLVLGMCFFFGGLRRQEQFFNTTVAQTAASLLALAVASIIVPTVFDENTNTAQSDIDVAALSRGTSVILLVVYAGYLFFQLKTHHAVFSAESQKVAAKPWSKRVSKGAVGKALAGNGAMLAHGTMPENHGPDASDSDALRRVMEKSSEDEDEEEYPQLHFWVAIATLTISTVLIAFCAEFMVDSIDAVTKSGGISEEFVGLILLPIVGNAAEHATAVTVAIKDKMDLAIGVAVGSSMQVALFLIPLIVVIGWCMGLTDMTLSFDTFQVAVLFVAVLLVNYLIADGKSHWLEGMQLMCLYLIIAVCSWCK